MQLDGFGDLAANGIDGIQRSRGFLKDVGDAAAADGAQALKIHFENVLSTENDVALDDFCRRFGKQAGKGKRRNAFSASALSHDGKRRPFLQRKGDILHGIDEPLVGAKSDRELMDFEQIGRGHFFSERVSDAWRKASPAR